MLHNYLIIAYRNLLRHKSFSAINIIGLAIGMAACLVILHYISFELSYDRFHEKGERIYRIRNDHYDNKGDFSHKRAITYGAVSVTMKKEFPEVVEQARFFPAQAIISYKTKGGKSVSFREKKVAFVDASFLTIFSFPVIRAITGPLSPEKLIENTNTIILTESMAHRYFGWENPLGKTLTIFGEEQLLVTGVMQDVPVNSHIYFDCLVSYSTLLPEAAESLDSWNGDNIYAYVQLAKQADPKKVEEKLPAMLEKYRGKAHLDKLTLQPLSNIHLYSDLDYEAEINENGTTVKILAVVALLLALIAWINFINLSTARAMVRAKEVGIRKVIGSGRTELIKQFILEALLLNCISAIFAITIAQLSLPLIQDFTGWELPKVSLIVMLRSPVYGIQYPFVLLFILGSFLSALYPAFVLSAYSPMQVLKGQFKNSVQGILLRKSLVVFQFAASVLLIAATMAVYQQLSYMLNENLGVNIEKTLVIDAPSIHEEGDRYAEQLQIFRNELLQNPSITGFSVSSDVPGKPIGSSRGGVKRANAGEFVGNRYNIAWVDEFYFPQYEITFLAGRNFSQNFSTDKSEGIILNETACRQLGFANPQAAVGEYIFVNWQDKKQVIGVIKDYHQHFLKEALDPVLYEYAKRSRNYFSIKINASNFSETIGQVQQKYTSTFAENPFNYFFLDAFYDTQYKSDRQFLKIFGLFASLAIAVACLGLFGLASFTMAQRTKEVGVRKVLGASVNDIVLLLSKDFIRLVLVASFIAWPLVYWGIHSWLNNYAFRIGISAWFLILPAILLLLIALTTISLQTLQAARANPVKSLRYE
ncbi:ABC transporter permease [Rhodocytophaga rosea]|uniref:ABC transporter permease n=1 Tax=Rhodocytophaga rosea TaxID=2704465 RepID=A0A6C0GGM7_9BACT|nr:ABC transporter permease [Rhodocytophaga rosea]QHT67035.1 ABC transporter permease [Rhodocytophaga rosea]